MTTTFSQYAAERRYVDTVKSIARKGRETRKNMRLPLVAANRRFVAVLVEQGYDDRMACEIVGRASEVADLEIQCEREA